MAFIQSPFLLILILGAFITSCNGQNKGEQSKINDSIIIGTTHTHLFKSQPTKNGPAENVRTALKDRHGNLWFGTTGHGVFKYDGDIFTLYTIDHGLGGNRVVALCEDKDGNVLLGTDKGLYYYDGQSIKEYLQHVQFGDRSISTLYKDRQERIWIGTHHAGIFIYDGGTLTRFLDDPKIVNVSQLTLNGISDIAEDHKGEVWLTSWAIADEGIIQFTNDSLLRQSRIHQLPDSLFYSVLVDTSETYWFGSRKNGLFNYKNGVFHKAKHPPLQVSGTVTDMIIDSRGHLWFTTGNAGVFRYNPSGSVGDESGYTNFTTEAGLIDNSVFTVVEDNSGNLWFGTRNVGLCRFDGNTFVDFSK